MSCNTSGIVAAIVNRSTPSIVQGSDSFLVVGVTYRGTDDPYAFESFTGASAFFTDVNSAIVNIPATLDSADRGRLRIDLAASATSELAVGEEQTFQVDFEDARGLTKLLLENSLTVVAPLFPSS